MERKGQILMLAAIAAIATLYADMAAAAQRTFVASNGVDTNPCSLIAPCRAFAAAIAQTDAEGEVIVLDSAGYGSVTITQGVTISAPPGVYAGISVFAGQNGVTVNAGGTDTVILRGLTINDQGGLEGIRINTGGKVYVENCVINGRFPNDGIHLLAAVAMSLYVRDVTVRNAGSGLRAYALNASAADSRVYIARSTFDGNSIGIIMKDMTRASIAESTIAGRGGLSGVEFASGPLSSVNPSLSIDRSEITGHNFGVSVIGDDTVTSVAHVSNSVVSNNVSYGLYLQDRGYVRLMGSQVTGNSPGIGVFGTGGVIASLGNNMVAGNGGSPPAPTPIAPY